MQYDKVKGYYGHINKGFHVWSQASAAFCHQASGVVNAFVSNSAYRGADSIFWSVEMPTLLNNPRVTEIIIHIFE